nr:DUF4880 domain-containing protein [Sphingobium sp. AS12]
MNRLMHLMSGTATEVDAEALRQWRAANPAHEAAFRQAVRLRRLIRQTEFPPDEAPAVARSRPALLNRRMILSGGIAASLATWFGVHPPLGLWPSLAEVTAEHRTQAGQRARLAPAPGLAVELNGRSALSFADEGRAMTLIAGQAFVSVAGRPLAPITISAGPEKVIVDAGSLDVRTSTRETCITCVTGSVRRGVELLRAGRQLISTPNGSRILIADLELATAWREGMLIFRDTPLAEVIEAVNRHYDGRIILADDALGDRRLTGLFFTDQIGTIVNQLELVLGKRAIHLPGGIALLG